MKYAPVVSRYYCCANFGSGTRNCCAVGKIHRSEWSIFGHVPVAPTAKTGGTWGPGKNFPITAYMVMKGTARLVLMVVDMNLEGSNADAKAAIDSKESTLLQAMTAETVKVVTLDGVNGRYLAGAKKGGGREIDQIFSIKNHLYQVIAMTSAMATAQDIEDAKQFSESFHFGD
jgi:hypothetical protein